MTTTTQELDRLAWVGSGGNPLLEDGQGKAEHMAELVALVDHTRAALAMQEDALGVIAAANSGGQRRLTEARQLARTAGRALGVVSGRLDELTGQLAGEAVTER